MKRIRRIGVLTGGGDCPGLNAVIRAIVKSAIVHHGLEVWGIEDGYVGLVLNRMRPLDSDAVSGILTHGGTILGTSNDATPRHFPSGKDAHGKPVIRDMTDQVLRHVADRKLDGIIAIGGDGTMASAAHLIEQGVPIVGVPKTIDNDLMHTDLSFGFQTAVEIATEALDRIHTTAASHHRVMFVETMGRNAGWIALHAGLASGADVILIPEIPFHLEAIRRAIAQRAAIGRAFTIVAVAEGATPVGGEVVVDRIVAASPDHIRLGGISRVLALQLMQEEIDARATILGHVQRGGTPCAFDRVLATKFGHAALTLVMRGAWDRMVALQHGDICDVSIASVAGRQRTVPLDGPDVAAARGIGICLGDET